MIRQAGERISLYHASFHRRAAYRAGIDPATIVAYIEYNAVAKPRYVHRQRSHRSFAYGGPNFWRFDAVIDCIAKYVQQWLVQSIDDRLIELRCFTARHKLYAFSEALR